MPGSEHTRLRTERLVLRPFQADDAEAIARYADDEDYRRYLSPTHPGPEEFVAHNVGVDWSVERPWVITLGGAIVGSAFLGINSEDDAAELSCLVAPAFWRKGIALEASRAAVEHAFVDLELSKVVARSDSRHRASIRLMTKLGMRSDGVASSHHARPEGGRVDEVIYELTHRDWSRARPAAR
jgi:ribosomal-protein-alanine N-acetyltransferase